MNMLARDPQLLRLGAIGFLLQLAHQVLPAVAVLYMGFRYNWHERDVGLMLAFVGVCAMVVQGGLVRPVVAKIGERAALLIGLAAGAFGFAIYGFAPTGAMFLIGVPVMALWGFAQPSMTALMSERVEADEQGKLQGAAASLMGLSGLAGPWVFALSFAYAIDPAKGLMAPGLPFYLAALALVAAFVIAIGVARKG